MVNVLTPKATRQTVRDLFQVAAQQFDARLRHKRHELNAPKNADILTGLLTDDNADKDSSSQPTDSGSQPSNMKD